MFRVREVKTKVGSHSIQVVRYVNGKRIIVKHIGTGSTTEELVLLREAAGKFIEEVSHQAALSFNLKASENDVSLAHCVYQGFRYNFLYEVISGLQDRLGYRSAADQMLNDLVVMRILEPVSKLRSIELMKTYFGINHRRQRYYESALSWLRLKDQIESKTLQFAKATYGFDFSLLFYDVTTLYFETFESDDLRKTGFSKDSKSQQPQILVGLMVTKEGFPVSYGVFPGNTFEGHTMLPMIRSFIDRHQAKHFTVVADAAMISTSNISALQSAGVHYIVGARLGNVTNRIFQQIDKGLIREDGETIRLQTENGFLVCGFSMQRYKKDKYEMEKQIAKAKLLLKTPSRNSKIKFLKTEGAKLTLHDELISKTEKLLGIKGYYTDLPKSVADNNMIMDRYHDLYKVEQAFRISKTDLQTRPIFHFKEEPIKLHLLICFMALAISKQIEITTEVSIRAFITECKKVTDAIMIHKPTQKEISLRAQISPNFKDIVSKLARPH